MSSDQDKSVTARDDGVPTTRSPVDSFLAEIKELASAGTSGHGRIIFALDATASREATWDTACKLQADMFREVAVAGGLEVQLVFYRGDDQCSASRWTSDTKHLTK